MSILAGTESNAYTPRELFASDAQVVTNAHIFATGLTLVVNSVVAFSLSNQLIEWVPGAADATGVAIGITCEALDTSAGVAVNPIYEGGYFNTDAINWPAAATAAEKMTAFAGSNIHHRALA